MRKALLIANIIFILIIIIPIVSAVIEEDWSKYTRIEDTKRDSSGSNVTLSWLRKSYTNGDENYTVTLRGFDPEGIVALDVVYNGRKETVILKGEWDENKTKIIAEPVEIFNKTMIITPNSIVPPAGIYTCCPEAEININLIRPELYLEFNKDTESSSYSYTPINPYANWSYNAYNSPYDNSSETKTIDNGEKATNAYRMNEEIPIEIIVTNKGDAESTDTEVFIDTDGLKFENGYPHYQLPTLAGENQNNYIGPTNQTLNLKLKFPSPPKKINYTVHAYVKGVKEGTIYYYDDTKDITLLPSLTLQKSVTRESTLLSRRYVESIYPAMDPENISRWLQGEDIFVTIGVTNHQNYEIKGLILNDTPPRQLSAGNESLDWRFDLKPNEAKEFRYKLKAKSPGRFTLPPAQITYSDLNLTWNVLSNAPPTEVHGPCLQIYKKTNKPIFYLGENTTVTLTVRNSGDMPSKFKITDTIPENSTLLDGQMYHEGLLMPKESTVFSYNIILNSEGQIQLPAPQVYANDNETTSCIEPILSQILVKEPPVPTPEKTTEVPAETPVATPIPTQEYKWLEGVIPALMFIFAVTVLLVLHRSSR